MGKKKRFSGAGRTLACLMALASLALGGGSTLAQAEALPSAKPFTLEPVEGKPVSLADYLGKKHVLLVFISVSCFECDETIPVIGKAIDKYQKPGKLQVIYVALANRKGARWLARSGKYDSRAPLLIEKAADGLLPTADDYGVVATPHLFLIDPGGKIRWNHLGRVSFEALDAELQRAIPPGH